jgi:DNA-binding CsgD family transcriptional regulator
VDLLGREREKAVLDRLLDTAREGSSGVVVVRGDPGVGKTALLDYIVERAADFLVVRFTGVEPERDLGYAALHRLLTPILHQIERLPTPQRDALNSALGLAAGAPANPFLVGLGTISLAANAARARGRLLTVIDDAHWVDRESLAALAFWGRRIRAEGIALVFATRDAASPGPLATFDAMNVGGLDPPDAQTLLRSEAGVEMDHDVAMRIVEEIEGNPLAIVELARGFTTDQAVGVAAVPHPLPVSQRLEERFTSHVRRLPADTQILLLLAAADSSADAALVWRAATLLGVRPEAAEPAEAADLVVLGPSITYRHPLIRSAVYGAARASDRRAVHRALAAATDPVRDGERHAWHLAAASIGADEEVAAVLEQVADRANARGSFDAELACMSRSAELTPDRTRAAQRRLRAAEAALRTGSPRQVQALISAAVSSLDSPADRARASRLVGIAQFREAKEAIAARTLLRAALELMPLDPVLGRRTLFDALNASLLVGTTTDPDLHAIAAAAASIPARTGTIVDELLHTFTVFVRQGFPASVPLMRAAVERVLAAPEPEIPMEGSLLLAYATEMLWDQDLHDALAARLVDIGRARADLSWLPVPLLSQANSAIWSGRLAAAEVLESQAADIYLARGETRLGADLTELPLLALRGREDLRTKAASARQAAEWIGNGHAAAIVDSALVKLELALGLYADALDHAVAVFNADPVLLGNHVLADLIEAAVRAGNAQTAESGLRRLAERAPAAGTAWAIGLLARSRALTRSSPHEVEDLYREAIDQLSATRVALEVARTHLLFGEWLRREKRRIDARDELKIAYVMFDEMGASAFAKRARDELLATGEHVRKRTVETSRDLTAQERHIADLVAGGHTNAEIAEQLFISTSTVEYHLRKIFHKLGIASRRELRPAVARQ